MIDLYYWPTPNGWKITIALEELEIPYTLHPVNIGAGEQFSPAFLAISPNNRMPAIVDHAPSAGGPAVSIFESAAILQYLAEKTGRLMPTDTAGKYEVLQWLAWQVAGLGPMAGQAFHFRTYAPEKIPYAIDRYAKEVERLYGVMERRLADRDYLAGDYSIADIAAYPWVMPEAQGLNIDAFPRLAAWKARLAARPAVAKGMKVAEELRKPITEDAKKVLFGQGAKLPDPR